MLRTGHPTARYTGLDWPFGEFAGSLHVPGAIQLHAFGAEANDVAVFTEDFDRVFEEVNMKGVRGILGLPHSVLFQGLTYQVLGF